MGEDIKVRALANGRMEISHLNNGSDHPGVAQNLQNRIAIFLRVADGILPILDEVIQVGTAAGGNQATTKMS